MTFTYPQLPLNIIFHKPAAILINIQAHQGLSQIHICRYSGCTYSHFTKMVLLFEKSGLLLTDKQGRDRNINLTEKGENVVKYIRNIIEVLK